MLYIDILVAPAQIIKKEYLLFLIQFMYHGVKIQEPPILKASSMDQLQYFRPILREIYMVLI